ncbi:cytochrome P450 [Mytilinidion resinicola]|uniref:Cytochrome P450 n=1 Tax=Mytilinidion resinicola TaxID=574789 RepID=A0A6A6YAU2_9PEZI|nr:cytochrome P450 [Mytilinidion resinicola]KAF2805623.1 cytochrome P450 [Mytilinidion resinicola]
MQFSIVAAALAMLAFALTTTVGAYRRWNKANSPWGFPGPGLIPYIGHVHDLPECFWLKLAEWSYKYGGIYKTRMIGWNFVIISDESIANDLLVKRAKIYSDRPAVPSLIDSKSNHGMLSYLPLMGRNQAWVRQRKWAHSYLTQSSAIKYKGIMEFEVKRLLFILLSDSEKFSFHIENQASKVMCTLAFDDPSFSPQMRMSAWGLLTQMSPNGPITNVLTPLWHLPLFLNPWKRSELVRRGIQQAFWMDLLNGAREKWQAGQLRPCWARQYLELGDKSPLLGDFEGHSALGMLALVGVFTVGGPTQTYLIAMIQNPEWMVKCQEEIDRICEGRPPTLHDYGNLPVLRACIKETFRWRSPVPTGVAHELEADDYYRGGFIPKGTRVIPLDWAMMRNKAKYPDPENYHPERWLEPGWPTYKVPLTEFPTIKGMSSFGWGIRACLGQTLTQDALVVLCGGLMWAFNVKHKTDPVTGAIIPISPKTTAEVITKPLPFEMVFEPRSEERKATIVSNWLEAEAKDTKERHEFLRAASSH